MNTEDFVTYEQALALKKLGFREKCLYYYFNHTLHPNDVYAHKVDRNSFHRVYSVEALSKIRNVAKEPAVCDAPTLSQVQKWLRKEKGICVEPIFIYEQVFEVILKSISYALYKRLDEKFNSYEEALSDGITECLKLLGK